MLMDIKSTPLALCGTPCLHLAHFTFYRDVFVLRKFERLEHTASSFLITEKGNSVSFQFSA